MQRPTDPALIEQLFHNAARMTKVTPKTVDLNSISTRVIHELQEQGVLKKLKPRRPPGPRRRFR